MKLRARLASLLAASSLAAAGVAHADSVSPANYSTSIAVGANVVVHKTVTIDAAPPKSAPVDVVLLSDTTGSMGGAISSVKTGAQSIITATSGLGDVRYAVGEYKDFGDVFAYRTNTDLTATTTVIQTGINAWGASGGGDFEEAGLFALERVANTISWRPGSTRIVVWFGDAVSHDPSGGVTEATAISALVGKAVSVEALDVGAVGTYYSLNGTGQATRITNATHGHLYSGVTSSAVASTITNAITTAISTYSVVGLDLSGVPSGVTATATAPITGSFVRDSARTFSFDVTFTGVTPGAYTFDIPVLVDSGSVAVEHDIITVTGGTAPTPPSCALTAVVAGPPKQLVITVQDSDDGIASIEVTTSDNASVDVPVYASGEKGALVVHASKVDPALGSTVALRITDRSGAVTDCDPVTPGDAIDSNVDGFEPAVGGCSLAGSDPVGSGASAALSVLFGLALVRVRRRRAA